MPKRQVFVPAIWFAVLVFWASPAVAQDTLWGRTYGGIQYDEGYSVRQTTDGGYIVVGYGAGGVDVYLVKTNSLGDTLWSRTYGGSWPDYGQSVEQTADGGFILAGYTQSFGAALENVYLIKLDSLGDTVWSRTYGGGVGAAWAEGYSVQQTADRGYIVAGAILLPPAGYPDVYLIKTDSTGDTLWCRIYGGSYGDYGHSVQETMDGGYIVAGVTHSFGAGVANAYLIKTDSRGDTLWTRTYGGNYEEQAYSVQQTSDGGFIVVGASWSFGASEDVYLIKTDFLGDTLWTRTCGGSGKDYAYSVQQTTDGGYIAAGVTESFGAGEKDVYLIKTDSTGHTLWTRTYGGSYDEQAYCVQQTTDEGYIVAGYTSSFGAGERDLMLTKLDRWGNSCIGGFVSSTVISVSPTITSPPTVVSCPPTVVTIPTDTVMSPAPEVTTVCMRVCGDVSGDGSVEPEDIVYLINYLFRSGSPPDPSEAGDVNCDGVVDPSDVVYLINYFFRGGPPPCC